MFDRVIAVDLAKRDAVRLFVDRLVEWIDRRMTTTETADTAMDKAYRDGWNAALHHVRKHLLG